MSTVPVPTYEQVRGRLLGMMVTVPKEYFSRPGAVERVVHLAICDQVRRSYYHMYSSWRYAARRRALLLDLATKMRWHLFHRRFRQACHRNLVDAPSFLGHMFHRQGTKP